MNTRLTISLWILLAHSAVAQDTVHTVKSIVEQSRDSVVVITTEDRDGKEAGLGSGFVVGADGLVATNLHVIGEARPIWVQRRDGQREAVTEVVASDRALDLAIIRIDSQNLAPLSLAKQDDPLREGQRVVAIGHPLGLKNSVVSGVVAGERDMEGTPMWQIAMPIEPGNSGGPLIDMKGQVQGVLALKATGPRSFGFAVKSHQLQKLLDRPNPIPMERWETIGQIDPARWSPRMGARWRQRRGRIFVEGAGTGFGGRALLLSTEASPDVPFEMAVSVKLDDETGAAGLVFHADGEERHYGFYPSAGRLRLTSFQGPDVFSWHVVREIDSPHYLPGEWNELKVRVEEKKITGYVNGQAVLTVDEIRLRPGRVGLCTFRQTGAEFKRFRVARQVDSDVPSSEESARLAREMKGLPSRAELLDGDLERRTTDLSARMAVLKKQARKLDQQAEELRALAEDLHVAAVCKHLQDLSSVEEDGQIDLLRGALWIARLDNVELEVDYYIDQVDRMAETIRRSFPADTSELERLQALDKYLFEANGYHGSRTDYYNAANSHLDRVIDDREGLPITLSLLYMVLADRLNVNIVGVGLPGHFVVRCEPKEGDARLIDVFDRGKRLSRRDAELMVLRTSGRQLEEEHLVAAKHRDILLRILTNLLGVAQGRDDRAAMWRYLEAIVSIDPEDPSMRGMRAVLRHQHGRKRAAVEDLDWILQVQPETVDLNQVRRIREVFLRP